MTAQRNPAKEKGLTRLRAKPSSNRWYGNSGKRAVDVLVTISTLPATAPLVGIGWLVARVSTRERGFFTQSRVGRGGNTFVIWKLRTMRPPLVEYSQGERLGITAIAPSRVTPAGQWLRRAKIDELPQLWNVLRGEMSLIGPRPDLPEWLEVLRSCPAALEVRPGLSSLASLVYADEEVRLAGLADPIGEYTERVLPHKVKLNEIYARNVTPSLDLRIVMLTFLSILSPSRARAAAMRTIDSLSLSSASNPEVGVSATGGHSDQLDPLLRLR